MMILLLMILFNTFLFSQITEDQIQNYLKSHFSDYEKVDYQLISKVNLEQIEIDYSKSIIQKSDVVFLPVLSTHDKNVNSVIRLRVKLFKNVLIAKKDIPFNKILSSDDFNYQLVEVSKLRGTLVEQEIEYQNYKSRFTIRKGEALVYEIIEELPVIKSGEKIFLEVQKGSVRISYQGIARQNGKIGEIIDVLAENNELLKAKVISSQKVLVE